MEIIEECCRWMLFAVWFSSWNAFPPVKTEFGWHVIKVEDRRQSSVPPFERVRPQIARDLGRRIAIEILNAARNGADIQRFTLDGQPLPPPSAQQQPVKK